MFLEAICLHKIVVLSKNPTIRGGYTVTMSSTPSS